MRRTVLYSRSPRARSAAAGPGPRAPESGSSGAPRSTGPSSGPSSGASSAEPPASPGWRNRWAALTATPRRRASTGVATLALLALVAFGLYAWLRPASPALTQDDIDAAVRHSLEHQPPAPSAASQAYEVIRPSVVLVRRLRDAPPGGKPRPDAGDGAGADAGAGAGAGAGPGAGKPTLTGIGTGVVFSEQGLIFTNLHVVTGNDDIGVVFADGTESEVEVVDAQPENDLAILKAKTLPDDLRPATLRSTRGLRTGDEVLAVGYPFGLGPTATWGVVSGLRRQHYSEQGRRNLVDLIQFDAAANPGNSGGPLVTRDGNVVGIVTSILNPTDEGFFVGIGFAVPIENAAAAAGISPF